MPELLEACLDLLGDGLEPLLLPPGPSPIPPPPPSSPLLPLRAVSLNNCKLTLAFLPPPEGPATAFAVALANAAKLFPPSAAAAVELMAESREPTTAGRSKMELPAEDETAPSDEAGEILRGVFGNGESGTGLDVELGGEVVGGGGGERGVGAARTRSDRAREIAAGVGGGGGTTGALGSWLAMMRVFTWGSQRYGARGV